MCATVCNYIETNKVCTQPTSAYKCYIQSARRFSAYSSCKGGPPTVEPTNQPGQWLKLPAAMAPMSPRMCSTRLQDCLSQAIWSHLEPSGQLALDFVTIKMSVEHCLISLALMARYGSIWLDMARYGSMAWATSVLREWWQHILRLFFVLRSLVAAANKTQLRTHLSFKYVHYLSIVHYLLLHYLKHF